MVENVTEISSPSVLIVDDDGFSQDVLKEMLQALGVADIQTTGNGREALHWLAGLPLPPDFLICDIFMPEMDGLELLQELVNQRYPGSLILVSDLNLGMLDVAQMIADKHGLKVAGAFTKPLHHHALAQAMGLQGRGSTAAGPK